jgi:flagellar biosynthesis/type III secretory pathway protein FliH
MSTGVVLRSDPPAASDTQRVVLRAQQASAPAEPAPVGLWITEQELAALKRQWTDQAREQGRAEGLRDAQEAAQQKADADAKVRLERELKARDEKYAKDQADKWQSLATALAEQMQSLRTQMEGEVSEWTFIAVTRLLGQRAQEDIVSAVKHVLADARLDGPVTILLHAQDLAIIETARAADTTGWPAGLTFTASDRLTLGGCLVQTAAQTLDARLEVQLVLLREALDLARHEQPETEA